MDEEKKKYYYEMKRRNRLIPLFQDGQLVALLTFLIGNGKGFVRKNPWSIVKDYLNGDTLYIDQVLRNKDYSERVNSLKLWAELKEYVKENYPNIRKITWNHWRNNKVNKHFYKLGGNNGRV